MRFWKVAIWISVAVGVLVGGLLLYIGFQHNPQGEFYDPVTGWIDYRYSFLIFFSWFVPASLATAVLCFTGWGVVRLVKWALRR